MCRKTAHPARSAERHWSLVFSGRARAGQRRSAACRSTQNFRRKAVAESPCSLAGCDLTSHRRRPGRGAERTQDQPAVQTDCPWLGANETEASSGDLCGQREKSSAFVARWRPSPKGELHQVGCGWGAKHLAMPPALKLGWPPCGCNW